MIDLLKVSLIGAVMILVITGVRALMKNRLHRTVFLLLWLMAALRLAVPMVFSSSASVYNFLPQQEVTAFVAQPVLPSAVPYEPQIVSPAPVVVAPMQSPADAPINWEALLGIVWAIGCGICFVYFLWVHIRARLQYRFALPEEGPAFLGEVRLKRCEAVSAPLVYGFFRPVILLPMDFPKKDSPEYEQVLWHELTHVQSGDLWYKLGMLMVTCVHWFNPLVWLMLHLSTQDMEIRCDARVIRRLGKKKAYALTLVQAEVRRSHHFAEAAFAFSLTELRLKAIARAKVFLPRSIVLFALMAVVLVCCFSTGPRANATEKIEETPTEEIVETVPPTETEQPAVETTAKPAPTIHIDAEEEMDYLLNCDFEEYGGSMELALKEGQKQTLALKLPEYTTFSVDTAGQNRLSLMGEYSREEEVYYLTVQALQEGRATVRAHLAGNLWLTVNVEIEMNPYYRVPDWEQYEPYRGVEEVYLFTYNRDTSVTLRLPERSTYAVVRNNTSDSAIEVSGYYEGQNRYVMLLSAENETASVEVYFYIDDIYWCTLIVHMIETNNPYTPSYNSSGSGQATSSSSAYDYLSNHVGSQPAIPGYSGGYSSGPIITIDPVVTNNGNVIPPGIYWP